MHLRISVSEDERELIRKAAKQSGCSVSTWAEVNLVDLARIETSADSEEESRDRLRP